MSTETKISAQQVNELRKSTGAGLMDCKVALVEAAGDMDQAIAILRTKGIAKAAKKSDREAGEGTIQCYIHGGGRVGVMLELNCETDFVAKNDGFKELARDLCMHIAAASPLYVRREDVPEELIQKEKAIAEQQVEGKPAAAVESIVKGKLDKWFAQICLMEQEYVKDSSKKIQDVVTESISKMGENILVGRFERYQIGA